MAGKRILAGVDTGFVGHPSRVWYKNDNIDMAPVNSVQELLQFC